MMRVLGRSRLTTALVAVLAVLTAGCGSGGGSASGGEPDRLTVGFVNGNTIEFHTCLEAAVRQQAEAEGVELVVANSANDPGKELSNVEDMITKQVDVIVVQTVNIDALQAAVDRANRADIPIFLTSVAAVDESKILGAVLADVESVGHKLGEWIAQDAGGAGEVAIVGGAPGASADLMNQGFKAGLGPSLEVVFNQPANWQRVKAQQVTENLLQSHPDVGYLFVHNEDMAFGALAALEAAGRDDIKLVTNNGTAEGLDAIRAGKFAATVSNTPKDIGEMAIEAVVSLHGGSGSVPKIQTVPDELITSDNVDEAPQYCPA